MVKTPLALVFLLSSAGLAHAELDKDSAIRFLADHEAFWSKKELRCIRTSAMATDAREKVLATRVIISPTAVRYDQIPIDEKTSKVVEQSQWYTVIRKVDAYQQASFKAEDKVTDAQKALDRILERPGLKYVGARGPKGVVPGVEPRLMGAADDLRYSDQLKKSGFFEATTGGTGTEITFDKDENTRVTIGLGKTPNDLFRSVRSSGKPGSSGWNPDLKALTVHETDKPGSYVYEVEKSNGQKIPNVSFRVISTNDHTPDKKDFEVEDVPGSRYTDMDTGETFEILPNRVQLVHSLTAQRKAEDKRRPYGLALVISSLCVGAIFARYVMRR